MADIQAVPTRPKPEELKKLTVKIAGMSCAACAARIERAISKIPGVEGARVNFAAETATVDYLPESVSAEKIFSQSRKPATAR